ncbi:MAG: cell surface protein [Hyphomicrobiales bacterium]
MGTLRDMGLVPSRTEEAPITALLQQISDLDPDRIAVISRTLNQASLFNDVVRAEVAAMSIGERYETITNAFNSIRDDAKMMVDQMEDGRLSTGERISNIWMKVSRGDIADRFEKIRTTYLDVARDTKDQIEREHRIFNAYADFRGALKQAQVSALEVLETATRKLEAAKQALADANKTVEAYKGDVASERAKLELARDERVRDLQNEEKRYQIAKDLADNLTIGYNTSEVVMARLLQTTSTKERVYAQSITFFSTNESVLTALKASFTGLAGLHESTRTLNEMKKGIDKSLETISEMGDKIQEEALKAGYGPTVQAESVKKLVDSVTNFQIRSREIIEEMRDLSTRNSREIEAAVEDGKRRLARLAAEGNALMAAG